MLLMTMCGVLLVAGLMAVVAWGGDEFQAARFDEGDGSNSVAAAAGRYLWYLVVAVAAGVGAGLLVAGAGGRLVMRMLAVTADDAARGQMTEAGEVIGEITLGGTAGFLVFGAVVFGLGSGVLYMLIRRWLPPGRWGGVTFGLLLLVVFATRVEPLNSDNIDFDLAGPSWLAVASFCALTVLQGMLVAAFAARYSRVVPPLGANRKSALACLPLLALAPVFPVVVVFAAGAVVAVVLSRDQFTILVAAARSQRGVVAGRLVLAAAMLVLLPSTVASVIDILDRTQ